MNETNSLIRKALLSTVAFAVTFIFVAGARGAVQGDVSVEPRALTASTRTATYKIAFDPSLTERQFILEARSDTWPDGIRGSMFSIGTPTISAGTITPTQASGSGPIGPGPCVTGPLTPFPRYAVSIPGGTSVVVELPVTLSSTPWRRQTAAVEFRTFEDPTAFESDELERRTVDLTFLKPRAIGKIKGSKSTAGIPMPSVGSRLFVSGRVVPRRRGRVKLRAVRVLGGSETSKPLGTVRLSRTGSFSTKKFIVGSAGTFQVRARLVVRGSPEQCVGYYVASR